MSSTTPTFAQPRVLTDLIPGARVKDAALTLGFTLAIAGSAQLFFYLPGNPVPYTGQTFVVLAGAIALGAQRATAGSLLYLALGALGLPFFAASGGATLGYIVGFAVACALLGTWASRGGARSVPAVAAAMVVGNLVIYAFGATWLGIFTGLGAEFAVANGVVPFLWLDAVKIAAAVAVVPPLWKLVGQRDADV
ncbi:biotin transporter BioY [Nitriliruptor alkaliphilus]|uniref:biotin transporter BioY n=1 Tax=Nitriliruptor alkaliphilus TaxID=427918 RepID=UPI0006983FEC|nr:biotin transporter BioY [Nitriliruptor alkaliphilus]